MKVLLLIDSLGAGGAERSTLDLSHYLRQSNHDVKIVCVRRKDTGVQQEAFDSKTDVHFFKSSGLFSNVRELKDICKSFSPDIVHATLFKSRLRARLVKLLYRKKFVLCESLVTLPFAEARIAERKQGALKVFSHKLMDSVLGVWSVDRFIAISKEVKRHAMEELYFQDEKKLEVIYRGRRKNRFIGQKTALRKTLSDSIGFDVAGTVFVHIGRQDFPKNHRFLVETFLKMKAQYPETRDAVLLCLGREGETTRDIQQVLKEYPADHSIFFLGHRSDVEQILAQSDIFIFPSKFEGLGGSVIEAKAAGLPIIVSDLAVFRETLEPGQEAFFVSTENQAQWIEKMRQLMSDENLRTQMGTRNMTSFERKFSLDGVNSQTVELYKQLLNENPSTRHQETIQGR
jgi:glycosyltransferase involved in cell wall biosynthesis